MKLVLCAVGRAKPSPERDLAAAYLDRIRASGAPVGITGADLIEVEERKKLPPAELKNREGQLLLGAVPAGAVIVALDERGKSLTSEDFAAFIGRTRDDGAPALACLIGGADGHAANVRNGAALTLSFGKATWPHMLVRAMAAEQLYRAVTILAGHPYHRGN
jgi:23S rRNA (pseudouridine1915-N3)-methyltransferase